jgi:hypothetical protein
MSDIFKLGKLQTEFAPKEKTTKLKESDFIKGLPDQDSLKPESLGGFDLEMVADLANLAGNIKQREANDMVNMTRTATAKFRGENENDDARGLQGIDPHEYMKRQRIAEAKKLSGDLMDKVREEKARMLLENPDLLRESIRRGRGLDEEKGIA